MSSDTLFVLAGMPPGMRIAFGDDQLARMQSVHPRVRVAIVDDQREFAELLPQAHAAFVNGDFAPLLAPSLEAGGRLRWVHSIPAGVNTTLTPELVTAEHVVVTSSKGPMGPMMAEHIVLLMLALARDLPGYLEDQAEKRWRFLVDERPMVDIFGRTIAILGIGSVGGHLARMCKIGFGMRVLGMARTRRDSPHVDQYVDRADLHDALRQADVVALALALTPETERIIDASALAAMKSSAYLVNVARGELVDQDALIAALRAGRLAGAGLDATDPEPLPSDSPLWEMPNVIVTPHVSVGRDRLGRAVVDFWCENIRRFAEGRPLLGAVDRASGY